MSSSGVNIMSGMTRFLSRREKSRDKSRDKRRSKSANRKVHHHLFHSSAASHHLASAADGSGLEETHGKRRRRSNSLRSLCSHNIPIILSHMRPEGGFKPPGKHPASTQLSTSFAQTSTTFSSDSITLQSQILSTELYTIFSNETSKKVDKEEDAKIKLLVKRLNADGVTTFGEEQCAYALSKHDDDADRAYNFLILASDSFEGILKEIDPSVNMLGAENRNYVTCYLDALLFAMFARLDSFEAILFNTFEDEPRKKLAGMLRLWVNMLRSGRLITVDMVNHLQEAIGACGWEEATETAQQDASEAFTFITGKLELPLLTLKMDIYHTGKEDQDDDHKFVNERLLEVALPEPQEGKTLTLEDCLETYFNNRIEVKRHLQRRGTLQSIRSFDMDKSGAIHIESTEVSSISSSPIVMTPTSGYPPPTPTRPITGRKRTDSIFSERYVKKSEASSDKTLMDELAKNGHSRPQEGSLRKEVMMPAWQFFSLIPWYTDNVPKSDAQVAAHFSAKRPVLGICLKRYAMLPNGTPQRLDTYVDIPLEIGLPHFISDDRIDAEGPLFGNFKLVLQSVVCHRGVSVNSGHYISLVRANTPTPSWASKFGDSRPGSRPGSPPNDDTPDTWMRFDDLANERVTEVDIAVALKEESPYLLFYQVQPIDEELARGDPPSYSEAQSGFSTVDPSVETLTTTISEPAPAKDSMEWDRIEAINLSRQPTPGNRPTFSSAHQSPSSTRPTPSIRRSVSFEDVDRDPDDASRGRSLLPTITDDARTSLAPTTKPSNSKKNGSGSKSRPTSQSGESTSRLSFTKSRLTGRASKDKLPIAGVDPAAEKPLVVVEELAAGNKDRPAGQVKIQGGLGRAKSKKEKVHKHHRGKLPERECVVM